jgi:phosphotriesterase-related protein
VLGVVAADEILLFKHAGGRTVVDPTPRTLARDPLALARIARATGLNVVMGAGYYHLLVSVVPRLRAKGVDDAGRRRRHVENPARAFAFA